ncbi:MAG: glycosyltransferase [Actinobacteria bacterium]|nr:glycosyltransferase [Actinomycetota bacterium]
MSEPEPEPDGDARARPDSPPRPHALSVVIAAHDAAATLPAQLAALATQDWDHEWEILVVDNASTDDTAAVVRRAARTMPRLRLVTARDGRGPAYARNQGAAVARGSVLAFCDADDVVGSRWVGAMGDALAQSSFVCGPVELHRLNPAWIADSRGSTGTASAAWFEDCFPFASSCNMGVARDRFLALGGFDELLQVGEDIDLSMRLHLAGVTLAYVDNALVHYRLRPTLRATFERAVAYGASRPVLAERWRERTGSSVSRMRGLRNWAWLVRHAPELRTQEGRAHWCWVAGQRVGALRGSWSVRRCYF